jgi:microcystin-dependent protein
MLDKLAIDDFSPPRSGAFLAQFVGGGSTTLDLVVATPFPQVPVRDGDTARRPFSVTFRAPIPVNIPQGLITLEHDRHGPLEIFVVPVGRDAQGLLLEAVFNWPTWSRSMATPFIAEIRVFSFPFAPKGWAFCNGQMLPIQQNAALFSIIGTFYGGNGTTTFGLPNLQGNVPISQGTGQFTATLGSIGGATQVTLTTAEMPAHTHPMMGLTTGATSKTQTGAMPGNPGTPLYTTGALAPLANTTISTFNGGQPHSNLQPYLVLNFCIALVGLFPTRN